MPVFWYISLLLLIDSDCMSNFEDNFTLRMNTSTYNVQSIMFNAIFTNKKRIEMNVNKINDVGVILLQSVLSQQYDKHPIIILKDVKYAELRAMMDYMYRGEVNISQDQLAALLKAAESLQIKGLSDNKPSRPPSRPAQAVPAHPPRAPSPPPQVCIQFITN